MSMLWKVRITVPALKQLADIKDARIKESIANRINTLARDPKKQGKPMNGELTGYRSIRAVGQRSRIIYKLDETQVIVFVVGLGIRKDGDKADVYELAKKMLRLGLLDTE